MSITEERPFAGYTLDFQSSVLALMYNDIDFLGMISGIVKSEHFDEKVDSVFAEIFLNYAKYYKDPLSTEVVTAELRKLLAKKKIEKEELSLYIKHFVKTIAPRPASPEWIKHEIRDFVCSKAIELELVNSVDLLKKRSFKEIIERVNAAYEKATKSTDIREQFRICGAKDSRFERYADPDALTKIRGHASGIQGVDDVLYAKGVAAGEILVVCGSPGRGKSIFLLNTAIKGLEDGESVLYYTLEVAQMICENRFDACLTGVPIVDLYKHADVIRSRWGRVETRRLGEVFLVDLPPRYLTPNMIRRDLTRMRDNGIIVDRVVVDYADIMASDRNIDDRRLEHGDVYEQLRGVAKEFNVSMWTASQANRDSLRKADVDIDSLAEDFSKAMTADYVIGLSQTKSEEAERPGGRGTGTMRLFFGKNRNGPKGITVPIVTDFIRMRMSMDDWDAFDGRYYGAPTFRIPVAA